MTQLLFFVPVVPNVLNCANDDCGEDDFENDFDYNPHIVKKKIDIFHVIVCLKFDTNLIQI